MTAFEKSDGDGIPTQKNDRNKNKHVLGTMGAGVSDRHSATVAGRARAANNANMLDVIGDSRGAENCQWRRYLAAKLALHVRAATVVTRRTSQSTAIMLRLVALVCMFVSAIAGELKIETIGVWQRLHAACLILIVFTAGSCIS